MTQFLLAANEYTYLEFHTDITPLKMVLWGIYAGILIGIAAAFYRKIYLGAVVRKLLKVEALSRESAITLEEAGIKPTVFYKNALKDGRTLRKYVSFADPSAVTEKEVSKGKQKVRGFFGLDKNPKQYDFSKIKLYVPEELKYKADVVYEKQGASPLSFILLAVVLTAFTVGISYVIPELLTMLDNFLKIILENRS